MRNLSRLRTRKVKMARVNSLLTLGTIGRQGVDQAAQTLPALKLAELVTTRPSLEHLGGVGGFKNGGSYGPAGWQTRAVYPNVRAMMHSGGAALVRNASPARI